MFKYKAVCNLTRKRINTQDAMYEVTRSHLNQPSDYPYGEEFSLQFESESALWLKDSRGYGVCVPLGEKQCFELVEE